MRNLFVFVLLLASLGCSDPLEWQAVVVGSDIVVTTNECNRPTFWSGCEYDTIALKKGDIILVANRQTRTTKANVPTHQLGMVRGTAIDVPITMLPLERQ